MKIWSSINLPSGHRMSHKKIGPDRFSSFDVYRIQTNRQTDKPNLYIDSLLNIFFTPYIVMWITILSVGLTPPLLKNSNLSDFLSANCFNLTYNLLNVLIHVYSSFDTSNIYISIFNLYLHRNCALI